MNKQKLPTKEKTGKVDSDSAWKDVIEDFFNQDIGRINIGLTAGDSIIQ